MEETSIEEAQQQFDTNFFGVLRVIQVVLPAMRRQRSGRIVNVSSALGFLPAPFNGIYGASKYALEGYTETLDHEVRIFGIRAVLVEPVFTKTKIGENKRIAQRVIDAYAEQKEQTQDAIQQRADKFEYVISRRVSGRQKYVSRIGVFVRCTIKERKEEMSTQTLTLDIEIPKVVSPKEWEAAREKLLVKEKELTQAHDALAAERRRMPWVAVEKEYKFDGPNGKASLLDLFDGRRQLIVYRAFFEPAVHGWPEHACIGCSMLADQVAHPAHLNARDTTLVFASRAPRKNIERLKARMGWELIPWYTITDDFDKDFGVDEWHGTNAFIRNGDKVFRTYFINSRGDEHMGSTWSYLDITALGRQEKWEDSPKGYPQTPPYEWWNWHDEFGAAPPSEGWSGTIERGIEAGIARRRS